MFAPDEQVDDENEPFLLLLLLLPLLAGLEVPELVGEAKVLVGESEGEMYGMAWRLMRGVFDVATEGVGIDGSG